MMFTNLIVYPGSDVNYTVSQKKGGTIL